MINKSACCWLNNDGGKCPSEYSIEKYSTIRFICHTWGTEKRRMNKPDFAAPKEYLSTPRENFSMMHNSKNSGGNVGGVGFSLKQDY